MDKIPGRPAVGVDVCTITPAIHYCMGGVRINASAQVLTEIPRAPGAEPPAYIGEWLAPIVGLFGAGEVTGGVHGANRLGGSCSVPPPDNNKSRKPTAPRCACAHPNERAAARAGCCAESTQATRCSSALCLAASPGTGAQTPTWPPWAQVQEPAPLDAAHSLRRFLTP